MPEKLKPWVPLIDSGVTALGLVIVDLNGYVHQPTTLDWTRTACIFLWMWWRGAKKLYMEPPA